MEDDEKKKLVVLEYLLGRQNRIEETELIFQIRFNLLHIKESKAKRIVNYLKKNKLIEHKRDENKIYISQEGKEHLKYLKQLEYKDKEYDVSSKEVQLIQKQVNLQEQQTEILKQQKDISKDLSKYTLFLVLATIILALGVIYNIIQDFTGGIGDAIRFVIIVFILLVGWELVKFVYEGVRR